MQKVITTALAIPVLAYVYVGTLVRRAGTGRTLMALLAVGLTGVLIATAARPAAVTGTLPARNSALDPAEFTPIVETGDSPSAPIVINFPNAMNTSSVEKLTHVQPVTDVSFSWDTSSTLLTIRPQSAWGASTFHTITVEPGALDATGRPLDRQIRSVFLTRAAIEATLSGTDLVAGSATSTSRFRVTFDGPVDAATIALDISPAVSGRLSAAPASTTEVPIFEFIPDQPLDAGATYTIGLAPAARDADGAPITASPLTITTAAAPKIVRFRPVNASTGVAWTQNLSVRFTEPMDHATTELAWSATQGGKALKGSFSWAEGDTVLVFDPATVLGYSQKVALSVGVGATSQAGLALGAAGGATFTTAARTTKSGGGSGGSTGGGTIGSSTWSAVEAYYLKLMNCTRTGGIVTSTGACSSPGGRNVAALWQDAGLTSKVSRPYAKKLAVGNLCDHFVGGTLGDRLKAAGYTSYIWGENLGCRSGDPYAAVLGSHLFFQAEKSTNGGHYVNLMNAAYDRVGIGVWVSSGRVRLVVDFYHPN